MQFYYKNELLIRRTSKLLFALSEAYLSTDEKLTPRAGSILLGEYLKGIGLDSLCTSYFQNDKAFKTL